jgi:uncharacterized repeat protein (TIGR01451 family)
MTRNWYQKLLVLSLIAGLLVGCAPRMRPGPLPATDVSSRVEQKTLGAAIQLPLYFIANQGQRDARVAYYAQGNGFGLDFTTNQVTIGLGETILHVRFPDAQVTRPAGVRRAGAEVNTLIGDDPTRWRTGIPTYGQVVYQDLYPGIDLYYAGQHGALKYTLVIAPDADLSRFRPTVTGAGSLRLDETGDLIIMVEEGELRDTRPYAYQEIAGQPVTVDVAFVLHDEHTWGFEVLSPIDPRYPLVIDPTLDYLTYLGGGRMEEGWDIAVDEEGFIYVAGLTNSSDLPTTDGTFQPEYGGGLCGLFDPEPCADAFVAKIDPTQSGVASLVYATYLGGSSHDWVRAIALDEAGNIYLKGGTYSHDLPLMNPYQDTCKCTISTSDTFVAKLDPTGSNLLYATYLGGSDDDISYSGIAADGTGNAYIVGYTWSADFPTKNAYQGTLAGGEFDAFVAKLDTTQSGDASLVYSTYLGGSVGGYGENNGKDFGMDIAIDGDGNAYVLGYTYANDFPTTPNSFQPTKLFPGSKDVFITKFNAAGTGLVYSTYLAGDDLDTGRGIAVDGDGNAYVTGFTKSDNFPTKNAFQDARVWQPDAFLTKLNAAGDGLVYSTYLGGSQTEQAEAIAVDGMGNAYVTGSTASTDFPTRKPYQAERAGDRDLFVAKFGPAGDDLLYSTYLGGSTVSPDSTYERDYGLGIAADEDGNAYVVGFSTCTDFPTQNAYQAAYTGGDGEAFVAAFDLSELPDLSTSTKRVSPTTLEPPGTLLLSTLHYTITLANSGELTAARAQVTDTLPLSLTLVAGPACDGGTCGYDGGTHTITWTGSLALDGSAVITYTGLVSGIIDTGESTFIVNTAQVADSVNPPFTLSASVAVNPHTLYLPAILK